MDRPTLALGLRTYHRPGDRRISRHRIWTMASDGAAPRPITGGSHDDTEPRWLPGEEALLFVRHRPGSAGGEIWRVDTDGARPKRLFAAPAGLYLSHLEVSPDGRWAAWEQSEPTATFLWERATGKVRAVTGWSWPEWRYDGRLRLDPKEGEGALLLDPKTMAKERIDADTETIRLPDGRTYGIEIAHDDETALMLVDPDGAGHRIVPDPRAAQALARNDRELVHARYPAPIPGSTTEIRLRTFDHRAYRTLHFRLDLATRTLRFWFDAPGPTRLSPDGTWFFSFPYERYTSLGALRIAVRNLYRTPAANPGRWSALLPERTIFAGYDLR